jgi:hypothetical protein
VRIEHLQQQISTLMEKEARREAQVERLRSYIYDSVVESENTAIEVLKVFSKLPAEDFDHFIVSYVKIDDKEET